MIAAGASVRGDNVGSLANRPHVRGCDFYFNY